MALNYVSLVFTEQDAGNDIGTGSVTIAPTSAVVAAGVTVVSQVPVVRSLSSGTVTVSLVATDNTGTTPAGGFWAYTITLPGGQPQTYLLPYSGGATQQFSNLTPVVPVTSYSAAPGLSLPVSIANGGTGQITAAAAIAALGGLPVAGGTMTGWLAPAVSALTDGATIAVNAALGNVFTVTLGGNRTLANPTNPVAGQTIHVHVTQDATGSRTLAYGTAYDFGTAGSPTLTTTAAKMDILGFTYDGNLAKWCYLGSGLGF
jgi:hypothetical protein